MVKCPKCDSTLDVEEDDLSESDAFSCDECGTEIVVISTNPLEVESAASADEDDEEEEDFDEDEDEDDEEEDEEEEDDEEW